MESSGQAADDQGSGWLQVKKKHRSSSKFSLQGWVGGFSGKHGSGALHSWPPSNLELESSHGKCDDQLSKTKGNSAVHGSGGIANSTFDSNKDEIGVDCLDKCVVSQDRDCTNSSPSLTVDVTSSDFKTREDKESPQKKDFDVLPKINNPGVLPKIKWGDLDDGTLILHCGKNLGAQTNVCGIENDNSIYRKIEDRYASVSNSFSSHSKGNVSVAISIDKDHALQEENSLSPGNITSKDESEVPSEDVKIQITNRKIQSLSGDFSRCQEINSEHIKTTKDSLCQNDLCETLDEARVMIELPPSVPMCEVGDSQAPKVPVVDKVLNTVTIVKDPELLSPEKSGTQMLGKSITAASVEADGGQKFNMILDDLSKEQIMSAIAADDMGESKERFRQRLWCFLFENLNRAVDELYLLCELECDVEQMKEAILVLEEAASDFRELNSRVEKFEKVKRSSSQSIDEAPLTMKSDHRRPHALSWEVRRMTSSPHRAEILSSSLEAFRKIQQERVSACSTNDVGNLVTDCFDNRCRSSNILDKHTRISDVINNAKDSLLTPRKQSGGPEPSNANSREKGGVDPGRSSRINMVRNGRLSPQSQSASDTNSSRLPPKENSATSVTGKAKKQVAGCTFDMEKQHIRKDKMLIEGVVGKIPKHVDQHQRQVPSSEKDREKRNVTSWESMNAWKEKRNWEDILSSPIHVSSRFSHSPGMSRKSNERVRVLHDKLMSPEKKKKTAVDLKKEAEEKHARAMRIRSELENERVQKLQRTSAKLNRVNEWQAVRSMKLRELMYARHQRSESRHEAFLAQVVRRACDESSKVNEVRFITSLNEENKKLILRQKLHDSELRRAEKLQIMRTKQKEDMAREEAVLGRKKLIEAEKLQRLAETQRKKEEAQVRREEERKASSAAREAKAMEQMRRKEERAKVQQEEAELLAQKLAEKLSESEQRRKFYLEQIRERASMDFRDQSSPLLRRSVNKDVQLRSMPANNTEDYQSKNLSVPGRPGLPTGNAAVQHPLKKRIKKIRQRLMSLKFEFFDSSVGTENVGIGYRTAVATARAKMGRWLQELQRLRQARKEGAASIGLIISEIIKFMEGKDPELQACRQAGLLDFIASALPASHTSKPEACQVTVYFLRLLKVVLSVPANRSYFLAQNLLPPIIPMLAAALENYIKMAASSNGPGSTNSSSSKSSNENLESVSEILDGFLWIVATIIGHASVDDRQLQMQDGLLELVVAYQVIHWLRDLFALYDRPQMEGSPFPSSILLSINLLAVLTSRFRRMSSIDWESFPVEKVKGNEPQVARCSDFVDSGLLSCNSGRGHSLSSSALNDTIAVALPDVPENQPLDYSCAALKKNDSFQRNNSNKLDSNGTDVDTANIPYGIQNILVNDIDKCSVSQRDEDTLYKSREININKSGLKQPLAFLLSAVAETGLVCLPSLLTAVLLQANNRNSSEQVPYILPSNFEEVATGVLRVLNNLALVDITFIQRMLARLDLKMEFFHLMSFLLSHCTSKWGVTNDRIGLLLLESLLLLGYFSLFHPENQVVLRWGKSPTILHKVCDLPFVFFSDPELMPVLAGTLVAACFGCELNKDVVQQELSTDMILSLLRSCRNGLPATNFSLALENPAKDESSEPNQLIPESRKLQSDVPQRISRSNLRNTRVTSGKGGASSNITRTVKMRNQKDKSVKVLEEMTLKNDLSASEASSNLMLLSRFPGSFIDKAEQFFSKEGTQL